LAQARESFVSLKTAVSTYNSSVCMAAKRRGLPRERKIIGLAIAVIVETTGPTASYTTVFLISVIEYQ
jgi:hypothetical protein